MPFQNDILGGASGQGGDYEIEGSSLWETTDSSYLYKTFPGPASPGGGSFSSNRIMTLSCWIKLGPQADFYGDGTAYPDRSICGWGGSGGGFNIGLHMQDYNPPSGGSDVSLAIKSTDSGGSSYFQAISEPLLRDPNAWYHLVVCIDSGESTAADRIKAWLNNVQIETWSQTNFPSHNQNMYINGNYMQQFGIGSASFGSSYLRFWDGYLAHLYYLDGQAKTPSDFAEEDSVTGYWKPIEYDGTFGNNGGFWKLDSGVLDSSFTDTSETFKSLYFDGTNDYVDVYTALSGGTNNAFSIAYWVMFNEFNGQIYSQYPDASSSGRFALSPSGSHGSGVVTMGISGSNGAATSANLELGTWYHMVLTRDGATWKWYVNGSLDTTDSSGSTDQLYAGKAQINARFSNPGYTSVRMIQFATWNIELTSSNVTGMYDSGNKIANWKTALSSGMKCYYTFGNNIITEASGLGLLDNTDSVTETWDRSGVSTVGNNGTNKNMAAGPVTGVPVLPKPTGVDTYNTRAQAQVGDSSIFFHRASGSYLDVGESGQWGSLEDSDWTFECWARPTAVNVQQGILTMGLEADRGWRMIAFHNSSGWTSGRDVTSSTNNYSISEGSVTASVNTWYHLAVVRNGSTIKLYVDGTSVGTPVTSVTGDFNVDTDSPIITIGRQYNNAGTAEEYFGGYIQDIRFSNTARYTANFTKPSAPFATDANTMLLIPSSFRGGLGGDSSTNKHDLKSLNVTADRVVKDSPTNNFCVINYLCYPRKGNNTYQHYIQSEGNLRTKQLANQATEWYTASFPITGNTGKWYWEMMDIRAYTVDNGTYPVVWGHGLTPITFANDTKGRVSYNDNMGGTYQWMFNKSNANVGSSAAYTGGTSSENKRVPSDRGMFKFCYDSDAGKFYWGGEIGWTTATSTSTLNTDAEPTSTNFLWGPGYGVGDIGQYVVLPTFRQARNGDTEALLGYHSYNFGQDSSFQGMTEANGYQDANGYGDFHYVVPTGYKALCSKNIDDPAIQKSSEAFNVTKYTGNGGTQAISGVGFKPDLTWIKNISYDENGGFWDTVRGPGEWLQTANTSQNDSAGSTKSELSAFDTDGFTVIKRSSNLHVTNYSGDTYAAWNWKATGGEAQAVTYPVTVAASKLVIGGDSQVTVDMREGSTYTFDTSDSSVSGHNFKFATAADAAGSTEYTTGVTETGTPGNAGAKTVIVVASSAPQLYYYCSNHSSMGGQANTNTTAGSSNYDGTIPSIVTANPTAGFSIVRYDGVGTRTDTVGHGLSQAPELIIIKRLDASGEWSTWFDNFGADSVIYMDSGGAAGLGNNPDRFSVLPTASVFTPGDASNTGANTNEFISYCFHGVNGFSQVGGYEGWGNSYVQTGASSLGKGSGGPFIPTPFQPAFVMIKNRGASGAWVIKDNLRQRKHNTATGTLRANLSDNQDTSTSNYIDLVSNGFKIRGDSTENNGNGQTYVYLAMADYPLKYTRAR